MNKKELEFQNLSKYLLENKKNEIISKLCFSNQIIIVDINVNNINKDDLAKIIIQYTSNSSPDKIEHKILDFQIDSFDYYAWEIK